MRNVTMNRVRALSICTHSSDYASARVGEAARHLLPPGDVGEEQKRLAMSATAMPEFLAEQQTRTLHELVNTRADHAVLLAIVQRMDVTISGLSGEVPALRGQIDRLDHRGERLGRAAKDAP